MLKNSIKDYFSFSRREKNSIIILLAIIIILITGNLLIPVIIKNQEFDYTEYKSELADFEKSLKPVIKQKLNPPEINRNPHKTKKHQVFEFNPNKASFIDLQRLGFRKKVIHNIHKYRSRGGVFFKKTDMLKIYGIDTTLYNKLVPFIYLNEKSPEKIQMKKYNSNSIDKKSNKLLNINKADTISLKKILGTESVLPQNIIKYRNLLGGFLNKAQFKDITGIEDKQYNLLVKEVYIDSSLITRININITDEKTLKKHPYLNTYYSKAILKYRNFTGEIKSINELLNKNILTEEIFIQIKSYLSVD